MKKSVSFLLILSVLIMLFQSVFAVKKDNVAPTVFQTNPANNASNVEVNKTITVKFSEKVLKGSTFSRIKLTDSKKVSVSITATVEKGSLVIRSEEYFDFDTAYILTLPANSVKDNSGNGLKKAYNLKFRTKPNTSEIQVRVFQNGKEVMTDRSDNMIHLDRDVFSLRFNIPIEGIVQLAALDNSDDYDLSDEGMLLEDIPYFTPGTGMATDGPYDSMNLNSEGNHYMFYSDDSDSRLSLISEDEDSIIDAEWQINGLQVFDTETYEYDGYSFLDFPLDNIYLVVVNDINNDGAIDEDEYNKLVLTFN